MSKLERIFIYLFIIVLFHIKFNFKLLAQYKAQNIEFSNGLVNSNSNSFKLKATLSMSPLGICSSENNDAYLGFWYNGNTLANEPTIPSKSITYHSITKNRIGLRWTNGNGTNRIILASTSNMLNSCYLKDGMIIGSGQYGKHEVPNNFGVYSVYNGNNATCMVEGLSRNTTYYFRIFEYNGSGSSCNYLQTTASNNPFSKATSKKDGEEIAEQNVFNIYPNPVKDVLNIDLNLPFENATISIINEVGQEVYSTYNLSNLLNINTSTLANGVYHILITSEEDTIYHSFVIER